MANQLFTNYDNSNMFVFNNRYERIDYTNSTYDDVTLSKGTIMGRVSSSQEIIPLESDASDGSQFPVGILAEEYTIPAGETVGLYVCVSGDVVEGLLVFTKVGDDLDTVISDKSIRDRIASDTVGIKLVGSDEMTATDNE